MPNMSCGKRCVPSKYDGVEPTAYQNFQQAHCLCPGLGPNARVTRTRDSFNGFKVLLYGCRHNKECPFECRIYWPMEKDPLVREPYHGFVALQILAKHHLECKKISWQTHLLLPTERRGKLGLHPMLKYAIDQIGGTDPHHLPKPDEMYNLVLEKFGDEANQLFPSDCDAIVRNQIHEYWHLQ